MLAETLVKSVAARAARNAVSAGAPLRRCGRAPYADDGPLHASTRGGTFGNSRSSTHKTAGHGERPKSGREAPAGGRAC
eukprot:2970184-Alexandrium_andersonii.AAC.1